MKYLLLLIILTLICATSCSVNVTYLIGVARLNGTTYRDYYFCCNTKGTALLWEVNRSGLGGYLSSNNIGRVLHGERSNFNYTASLLSVQPIAKGQFTFDSVLIVSVLGHSNLEVSCWNGSVASYTSTTNADNGKRVRDMDVNNSTMEEYLLSEWIVKEDNVSRTSIFICGVDFRFMYWRTSRNELLFSQSDVRGQDRQNIDVNATTVKQQAIVLAHTPYQIVSVFFVTHISQVTVTCGSPSFEVDLTSSTTTLEDTTVPETSTSSSTTSSASSSTTSSASSSTTSSDTYMVHGTMNAMEVDSAPVTLIIAAVVAVVAGCCTIIIISIVILSIIFFIKFKRRNQNQVDTQELKKELPPGPPVKPSTPARTTQSCPASLRCDIDKEDVNTSMENEPASTVEDNSGSAEKTTSPRPTSPVSSVEPSVTSTPLE